MSASSPILFHLPVYCDCYELVFFVIFELNDPMAGASKLSPAARLVRVLLDSGISAIIHRELDGFKALTASAANGNGLALHDHVRIAHHLGRYQFKEFSVRRLHTLSISLG